VILGGPVAFLFGAAARKSMAVVAQLMFSDKEKGSIHIAFLARFSSLFLQTSSSCLRTAPTASN
jgi:hypothetical protein